MAWRYEPGGSLRAEELLITEFASTRLRQELDTYNLWRDGDHLGVRQLWDYIASYLYLPRLKSRDVLLNAVRAGVGRMGWDTFAYAESWDEQLRRYRGLVMGRAEVAVVADGHSVLVKPAAASKQIEADAVVTLLLPALHQFTYMAPVSRRRP